MADMSKTCLVTRTLTVSGRDGREVLARSLARGVQRPWRYASDADDPGAPGWGYSPHLFLQREPRDGLGTVLVSLLSTPSGGLRLARMTDQTTAMTTRDWNGVAESLVAEVLRPAEAKSDGVRWILGDALEGPSDWFTPAAVRRLGSAIDLGGMRRRRDQGWLQFLVQVHADGEGLAEENLGRWLRETQGLGEPDAEKLMEFSHDVLCALGTYDALLEDRAERGLAA